MLRVILIASPAPDQFEAVANALDRSSLTSIYAPSSFLQAATAVATPHAVTPIVDERFEAAALSLEAITGLAQTGDETAEGTIAVVATVPVVRAIVMHALDAPVPEDRLAIDEGAIAEVEVRIDAPWTVNRINDGCHLVAR